MSEYDIGHYLPSGPEAGLELPENFKNMKMSDASPNILSV